MKLSYEDLISGDPIPFYDVCHVRSPKLSELKPTSGKGMQQYNAFLSALMWEPDSIKGFLKDQKVFNAKGERLVEKRKANTFDMYSLIGVLPIPQLQLMANMLPEAIKFFITEKQCFWDTSVGKKNPLQGPTVSGLRIKVVDGDVYLKDPDGNIMVDKRTGRMIIDENDPSTKVGYIDRENFEALKDVIMQLNFIQTDESVAPTKFDNSKTKKLWERAQAYKKQQAETQKKKGGGGNKAYAIGNVISKLCCASPSYNLTNVYDLTVYQAYDQFFQLGYLRVCSLSEAAYSHWGGKDFKMEKWLEPYKNC